MKRTRVICAFAATVALMSAYLVWENNALGLTEYTYASEKVSPALDGFKICHLSDIHNKRFGEKNSSLVGLVTEQSPDIIVITGDLVDSRHTDVLAAVELIEQLADIAPIYYVTGNHEERLPTAIYRYLMENLLALDVTLLDGRSEIIECGTEKINIAGFFDRKEFPIESARGLLHEDMLNILINHRPQFAPEYAEAGFDLAFSGHAHGGQVRIPFVGGVIAPDQFLLPKLSEGMHFFGDSATVISRGIGNSLAPVRVNNRPEVVIVTLKNVKP